jgi:hypothetical protein
MMPLKWPEFARIKLSDILDEVINEYKLNEEVSPNGWVYICIGRGMYVLPQSGSLGHDLLKQHLNPEGYFQSEIVTGLWKHRSKNDQFILVADNFGIKFMQQQDFDHLINTLKKHYNVSLDMAGGEYVKINMDRVHLSMELHQMDSRKVVMSYHLSHQRLV